MVPALLRTDPRLLSPARRAELDRFSAACRDAAEFAGMVQHALRSPAAARAAPSEDASRDARRAAATTTASIRVAARADPGRPASAAASAWRRTGCPLSTEIEDVRPDDVFDATRRT